MNSPLLKDYTNQILSNQIDSQRLKVTYRPQVSASSSNFYAPVVNGYGYDPVVTNTGSYNALINVDQAFIGKRNLQTKYHSIGLQNDSILNSKKISEQDLKRTITAQYITTYGDMLQLNFNKDVNNLLTKEDSILKRLTESNIYRQTDYLTFLVTLQQQQLLLKQLNIQFTTDFATLNYLCGIYDTSSFMLDAPGIVLQQLPDETSSVFFKKYAIDSLQLLNNIAILNYNYRPKANAYINGGYFSSLLYQSYKNFGTGIGLNVSVPIYDGHQRKLQYEKIKLLENTRSNYKDFFAQQYNQQITQLKQQLRRTEELITDIDAQIKYSQTLIDVNGKLMETGDAKIADFVIAINNYLNAKNLLNQNNVSRLQLINQLNYWNR
ncbi:MAG TPA: TolC family protein [Flavipsychrobacter sp.]|nr:TolC family protein [Flavipsychrobacter sp.]